MKEVLRVRCPVCGMMTDLEQMAKAEAEKPTEVRLFLQKFGGKVATEKLEAEVIIKNVSIPPISVGSNKIKVITQM